MSAVRLRAAAALMRERAEGLPPRWRHVGERFPMDHYRVVVAEDEKPIAGTVLQPDAEHIASWHPAVALAVADWLDATAAENDSPDDSALGFLNFVGPDAIAALAVADAYLGTQTSPPHQPRGGG